MAILRKPLTPTSPLAQVNAAARACGMSYGEYVAITGGLIEPPKDLLLLKNPDAKNCPHCNRRFLPTGRNQRYCSSYCRKAAYDDRNAKRSGKSKLLLKGRL